MNKTYENEITVILTAYKRVDSLSRQLESIRKQTIKPKEVWLFQDKIPKDYNITIDQTLLEQFDKIYIADENVGVWGRFNFAREVRTEYVCIFDDDTIPGQQWLENCYSQMQKQEGIYGTIGVIFTNPSNYTKDGHFRIGWHRPNEETKEVDLVGHSWFLKTKWLEFMFELAPKYSTKYKYAAEDMCLSYGCLLNGIHTYVPPHPIENMRFWGSQPQTALSLGVTTVALSLGNNNVVMNAAAAELVNDGWEILLNRNPQYVQTGWKKEKRYRWKARRKNVVRKISKILKKRKD